MYVPGKKYTLQEAQELAPGEREKIPLEDRIPAPGELVINDAVGCFPMIAGLVISLLIIGRAVLC